MSGRPLHLCVSRSLTVLLLLLGSRTPPAFGQGPRTGGLRGTVTDSTKAVLVGVPVTVSDAAGDHATKTNRYGVYSIDRLPPGRYLVGVSEPGFQTFETSVVVLPAQTTTLDVTLQIALSVSLQVTRSSTDRSAVVLSGDELKRLPDDPRLLLSRLLAIAGSTGLPGDVAVYVDGFREYKRLPPKNVIEMIRINSNPFSAEFQQPGAQRIEITTKPGADDYHGQVRLQARSSRLDARNAMATAKPASEYRNFNGYLQGPIKKNRLGFLAYGEHWLQDENAVVNATVLDPATFQAAPFVASVPTPDSVSSIVGKLDLSVFGQAVNASFTRTSDTAHGQGLASGIALADQAVDSRHLESAGRVWWTRIGHRSVTDFRVEVSRTETATTPVSAAPAVLVLDAFSAGGNAAAGVQTTGWATQAGMTSSILRGAHTFKVGFAWHADRQENVDRTGYNGAFTFGADVERDAEGMPILDDAGRTISIAPLELYRRVLLDTPGYRPSEFSIVTGNPSARVTQWTLGSFALDDWQLSKRVSVSYGVRQDSQNNLTWQPNLAPRFALSWILDRKGQNTLRFGSGVFYTEVAPGIALDAQAREGARQRILVFQPAFFATVPSAGTLGADAAASATLYTKARDLRTPRSIVASTSYERQLPLGLVGIAEYRLADGTRLLRLRNLAAGAPGVTPRLQFESTGRSMQHEVSGQLRLDANAWLSIHSNYRWSTLRSDTDSAYSIPSDSQDAAADYGASAEDRRHQVFVGVTAVLPRGLTLDASFTAASGRPFDITTGQDNNGDGFFLDRPAFAREGTAGAVTTPFGTFNPTPGAGDVIVPRNYGREPWQTGLNASLYLTLFGKVRVAADVQNLLNAVNLVRFGGVLTSSTFGQPRQALNARRFELTTSFEF